MKIFYFTNLVFNQTLVFTYVLLVLKLFDFLHTAYKSVSWNIDVDFCEEASIRQVWGNVLTTVCDFCTPDRLIDATECWLLKHLHNLNHLFISLTSDVRFLSLNLTDFRYQILIIK